MLPCCCATEEYIGASIDAGCGNGAKLWYAKKILKGFDGTDNQEYCYLAVAELKHRLDFVLVSVVVVVQSSDMLKKRGGLVWK